MDWIRNTVEKPSYSGPIEVRHGMGRPWIEAAKVQNPKSHA